MLHERCLIIILKVEERERERGGDGKINSSNQDIGRDKNVLNPVADGDDDITRSVNYISARNGNLYWYTS
jgi:hypothetical protein